MKRGPALVVVIAATGFGAFLARATLQEPLQAPLTFSGTVTGVDGPTADLAFVFERGGVLCPGTADDTAVAADGAFVASIALDETCDDDFFSGGAAPPVVSITVNNAPVVSRQPVGTVPFALFADQARQAQHLADPPCPAGYAARAAPNLDCFRADDGDVVVKVGSGATAFWMDRYEAAILGSDDERVVQAVIDVLDLTGRNTFFEGLRAVSREGIRPAENLTWLQANALCRAAGKRLPRRAEWLYAARSVDEDTCNLSGARRDTGGSACRSAEGVEDLFGNVQEFVEEWATAPGTLSADSTVESGFDGDEVFNVTGLVNHTPADGVQVVRGGIQAVEIRGGSNVAGSGGGFLFSGADRSPTNRIDLNGFRCVTPR